MALVAMICPSCGDDLQLDNEKEFGFCSSCGTKVMLYEKQEIHVTGSVTLDHSEEISKRTKLAEQAFQNNMYREAYEQYQALSNLEPDNYDFKFFKALANLNQAQPCQYEISELTDAIQPILHSDAVDTSNSSDADFDLQDKTSDESLDVCKEYLSNAEAALLRYFSKHNFISATNNIYQSETQAVSNFQVAAHLMKTAYKFCDAISQTEGQPYILQFLSINSNYKNFYELFNQKYDYQGAPTNMDAKTGNVTRYQVCSSAEVERLRREYVDYAKKDPDQWRKTVQLQHPVLKPHMEKLIEVEANLAAAKEQEPSFALSCQILSFIGVFIPVLIFLLVKGAGFFLSIIISIFLAVVFGRYFIASIFFFILPHRRRFKEEVNYYEQKKAQCNQDYKTALAKLR